MTTLIPSFEISGFWAGFLGLIIITLVNFILNKITK
jgi:uncharacterized membrane protein YvlD (DUF360 family)